MGETTPPTALNRAGRRAEHRRLRKTGATLAAIPTAFGTTALLLGATAVPAGAGTIEVQNLSESGAGSLRAALAAAVDGDVITFAPGLTGTIELAGDDLDVEASVTIQGPGAGLVTIDGNDKSRIFDLDEGDTKALTVAISGLTLTHGNEAQAGGAIRANGGDHLSLAGVTITASYSDSEGGAYANYDEDSSITIDDSVISGNTADDSGGGLYTQGSITIRNSVISGNTAGGAGGGVYLDSNSAGTNTVTIIGSVVSGNRALYGGGLWVDEGAGVTIQGSTFTDNHASEDGGGAIAIEDLEGPVSIVSSTISGNTAASNGGGLNIYYAGSVEILASTFSGNEAGGIGGAVALYEIDGDVLVANSTISGNTASGIGGGIAFYEVAELRLINDTITANTGGEVGGVAFVNEAVIEAARAPGRSDKGGRPDKVDAAEERVGAAGDGPHAIIGSIVWGNAGADLGGTSGVDFTSDHSLLGTPDENATITDLGGTITGRDPLLGPLADNGGPTRTHELLPGSPAINAGEVPVATFPGNEWDQRGSGYPRVVAGIVDIGAFEVQPAEIVVLAPNFAG